MVPRVEGNIGILKVKETVVEGNERKCASINQTYKNNTEMEGSSLTKRGYIVRDEDLSLKTDLLQLKNLVNFMI